MMANDFLTVRQDSTNVSLADRARFCYHEGRMISAGEDIHAEEKDQLSMQRLRI